MNYDIGKIKSNNTTAFLVAPIGIPSSVLKEQGFKGAYLGDINKPDIKHERGIFMLFRPPSITLFEEFLDMEKCRTFNLVEDYDYEGGYVVVIYILDEEFADDYEKFLKGQYSKFSAKFKSHFPKEVPVKDNLGRSKKEMPWQWRVFKKDKEFRQYWEDEFGVPFEEGMEVWGVPRLEKSKTGESSKEMLDIELIKKEGG